MSKFIGIGNVAVLLDDFKNLSGAEKIRILDAMFNGCGMETDNNGQIVQYTDLMFGDDQCETVVPLIIDPIDDFSADTPDPHEDEEEPVSSDFYEEDESLPPTLRPEQLEAQRNAMPG